MNTEIYSIHSTSSEETGTFASACVSIKAPENNKREDTDELDYIFDYSTETTKQKVALCDFKYLQKIDNKSPTAVDLETSNRANDLLHSKLYKEKDLMHFVTLKRRMDSIFGTWPRQLTPKSVGERLIEMMKNTQEINRQLTNGQAELMLTNEKFTICCMMQAIIQPIWIRKLQQKIQQCWGRMECDINGQAWAQLSIAMINGLKANPWMIAEEHVDWASTIINRVRSLNNANVYDWDYLMYDSRLFYWHAAAEIKTITKQQWEHQLKDQHIDVDKEDFE